nr:zinc finger protein weckle isoform X9 [Helicoverpa armigera]
METSVNNGMCRCCASEGAFKDVKSTYHWMGEEEIYSDMLRDCFDINLEVSEQGQDGGICEVCITQLRNAINFKKQVLHTEEQFKIHLQNKTMFRPNIVKVELQAGEDSDDLGSGDDAFSGPEFEVPIKMETEETKPKKRGAKASATTTRAKKAKADNGETSNKREPGPKIKIVKIKPSDKKKKIIEIKPKRQIKLKKRTECVKHKENIRTILYHTNATPIGKYGGIGFGCGFCHQECVTPAELKLHTISQHAEHKSTFMEDKSMHNYIVKLDITDLKCDICQKSIDSLDDVIEHLKTEHDKPFHKGKSYILPFKFTDNDMPKCLFCGNSYGNFKVLLEHMNSHYRNHVCSICDSGFVNKKILQNHEYRHKTGVFNCSFCFKEFDNHVKKRDHEKAVHIKMQKRNKCAYCGEKFADYTKKLSHETSVHGAKPRILKCQACDKTFDNQRSLTAHTKAFHLMEKQNRK